MFAATAPEESEELLWWLIAMVEAAKAALRESKVRCCGARLAPPAPLWALLATQPSHPTPLMQDFSFLVTILPPRIRDEFMDAEDKIAFCWYKFMAVLL